MKEEIEKMDYKDYFKKNGFIYGISTKFEFGRRVGYAKKIHKSCWSRKMVGNRRIRLPW